MYWKFPGNSWDWCPGHGDQKFMNFPGRKIPMKNFRDNQPIHDSLQPKLKSKRRILKAVKLQLSFWVIPIHKLNWKRNIEKGRKQYNVLSVYIFDKYTFQRIPENADSSRSRGKVCLARKYTDPRKSNDTIHQYRFRLKLSHKKVHLCQ